MRLALAFAVMLAIPVQARAGDSRYTGTFSSFEYNKEGGDLLGAELRIVAARGGYEGTFQFSEGEPDHIVLIKVDAQGDTIRFVVPPPCMFEGEFQGHIDTKGITGTLTPKHGEPIELKLPRRCGYWDCPSKP